MAHSSVFFSMKLPRASYALAWADTRVPVYAARWRDTYEKSQNQNHIHPFHLALCKKLRFVKLLYNESPFVDSFKRFDSTYFPQRLCCLLFFFFSKYRRRVDSSAITLQDVGIRGNPWILGRVWRIIGNFRFLRRPSNSNDSASRLFLAFLGIMNRHVASHAGARNPQTRGTTCPDWNRKSRLPVTLVRRSAPTFLPSLHRAAFRFYLTSLVQTRTKNDFSIWKFSSGTTNER